MMDMPTGREVYFDNAATSWPKPPQVQSAMVDFLTHVGGSPGRSGHRMSIAASRVIGDARDVLAQLFNVADPSRIAFAKNATEALNMAILGWLQPGDHVITSSVEHNSVMRPLRFLEEQGRIEVTVVPCAPDTGILDPEDVRRAVRPRTRLLAIVHGSNVVGTLQPIGELGAIGHGAGAPLLVDAAQTAGAYPIDVEALGIDMLAFTGHKSLLGPTGTGGLYLREGLDLVPVMRGGTGSRSELEVQPDFMPDKLESGTLNAVGIAGLGAGAEYLLQHGVEQVRRHEQALVGRFLDGAATLPGVTVYGPPGVEQRIGVLSFNIEGVSPSRVGLMLDRGFGIMTRIGLHCAPAAHRTIGTFPSGTVRFGFSCFNTIAEVDYALQALAQIIAEEADGRAS
jgi:cysteine desulfurase family protein